MKKIIVLSILILIGALSSCLDDTADIAKEEVELKMLTYSLMLPTGEKTCYVADLSAYSKCELIYGTSLKNVVAKFTLSEGTSLYLDDILQESGVTVNDFSSGRKIFYIKDKNGNSHDWAIDYIVMPNTESILYSASVLVGTSEYVCSISETNKKVTVDIADKYKDDLLSVKFNYVVSDNARFIIKGNLIVSGETTANIGSFVSDLSITIKSEYTNNQYALNITENIYQFIVKCKDCGN